MRYLRRYLMVACELPSRVLHWNHTLRLHTMREQPSREARSH